MLRDSHFNGLLEFEMSEHALAGIAPNNSGRPLGVWILAICNSLFVLPYFLLGFYMMVYHSNQGYELEDAPYYLSFLLAVLLSIFGSWWGNKLARMGMVILLTVFQALLTLSGVRVIMEVGRGSRGVDLVPYWITVSAVLFAGSVLLALNCWYFLGSRSRNFYS